MRTMARNVPLVLFGVSLGKALSDLSIRYRLFLFKNFLVTLHESEVARSGNQRRICLIDEGLIQRAYTLFFHRDRRGDDASLSRYISKIRVPDIVVYLAISPERALKRVQSRGLPARMKGLTADQKVTMLRDGETFLGALVAMTREHLKCSVLELNSEDIDGAVAGVLELLEVRLMTPRNAAG